MAIELSMYPTETYIEWNENSWPCNMPPLTDSQKLLTMQRYGGGSLLATFTLAYARRLFKCLYDQVVAKAQLHRIVRAHPHKNLIVILFIEIFFITLFTILLFLSISTLIIFFYTSLSYISLCFVQVLYKYNFSFNVLPSKH